GPVVPPPLAGEGTVAAFSAAVPTPLAGAGRVGAFWALVPPPLAVEGRVGAFRSIASATSRRRIDPPGPLPLTVARSIPLAFANNSAPSVTSTVPDFVPPPLAGEGGVGAFFSSPFTEEGTAGAFLATPSPS